MISRRHLSTLVLLAAVAGGCDAIALNFGGGATSSGGGATSSGGGGPGDAGTTGAGGDVCVDLSAPWSKSFGDMAQKQYGNGVAVDSSGNLVIAGVFEGNLDFGPCELGSGLLDAEGSPWNLYITKLDPGGCCIWSRRFKIDIQSNVNVAVDGKGNVVAGGIAVGTYVFDDSEGVELGETMFSVFVLKLDPGGKHVWSRSLHPGNVLTPNNQIDRIGHWVTVNPANDDVVVTGDLRNPGTLSMRDGAGMHPELPANALDRDSFVLKFDSSGALAWSRRLSEIIGAPEVTFHVASATISAGELNLTGKFQFFNPPPMTTTVGTGNCSMSYGGQSDIFATGLDPMSGTCWWGKGFGGSEQDGGHDLARNGQGDLFVSGAVLGQAEFGDDCGSLGVEVNQRGAFVMKLAGTPPKCKWVRNAGVSDTMVDGYTAVTRSSQGHVLFAGLWKEPGGGNVLRMKKFDAIGEESDMGTFPFQKDLINTRLRPDLAADGQDNAILIGSFAQTLDFLVPGSPLQTQSQLELDYDIFLAKFASSPSP